MGISGLLPLLNNITEDVHISHFTGKTVAVDTYCWLHRGTYTCSYDLCLNRPTEKYIEFCIKRLELLLKHKITPIMVFDGANLKQKSLVDQTRREKREAERSKGMLHLGRGRKREAHKCFQRGVEVTKQMAFKLIQRLQRLNVQCIVAPYEADAQLAFLSLTNRVDCVISEDSDLLVFGCSSVLYKLNDRGEGKLVKLNDLAHSNSVSFDNWTHQMFQEMCVLSGCDYLPSIPRIGLRKAHALMAHFRDMGQVISHLKSQGKYSVPAEYYENAIRALLTFQHQTVFDSEKNALCSLNPIDSALFPFEEIEFLGPKYKDKLAILVSTGKINPQTFKEYSSTSPSTPPKNFSNISSKPPTTSLSISSPLKSPFLNSRIRKRLSLPSQHRENIFQTNTTNKLSIELFSKKHKTDFIR